MDFNYLAMLVSVIVSMVIGSVWYSPVLFGNIWQKYVGIDMMKSGESAMPAMIGMTLLSIVLVIALSVFVNTFDLTTSSHALRYTLLLWGGVVVPTYASGGLFTKKPVKLMLIDLGNWLVTFLAVMFILVLWR